MHIGVFFGDIVPAGGGAFTFQQTLLDGLLRSKSDYQFTIFSYDDAPALAARDSVKFVRLRRESTRTAATLWGRMKRLRESYRAFAAGAMPPARKGPLYNAAWDLNIDLMWFPTQANEFVEVPYVFTCWDLQHRLQPYFPEVSNTGCTFDQREAEFRGVIPKAAFIVVGNRTALDEVRHFYGVPEERIRTLPLPTPDFALRAAGGEADFSLIPKKPFLFYPAQFWPHKNHVLILEALKVLKDKHQLEFEVAFAGSDKGNRAYVESCVRRLGLRDQTHFLGFVSTPALVELYRRAFALVFPTFFGPDNLPPLEAFALGCPVIASSVPGSEHQLKDAALLFDPRDEYALATQILRLKNEPALRNRLVARGKEIAGAWGSDDYMKGIFALFDDFAKIRRCWASDVRYLHP